MLILLPIENNKKCVNVTFQVIYTDDMVTIKPYNILPIYRNDIIMNHYSVITSSNLYGINMIPIIFPLVFNIINNKMVSDIFFLINTLSSNNINDFFSLLLNSINIYYKKSFIYFNSNNVNTIINTIKLNSMIDDMEYNNVENLLHRLYYRTNRYLNFSLAIMNSMDTYSISSTKICNIINAIKQMKCTYYGNNMTVVEHIDNINSMKNNNIIIKKNKYYYFSNNNKMIKLLVLNIKNNMLECMNLSYILDKTKYNITPYPPKFNNIITITNLISNMVIFNYSEMITLIGNIIYKKNPLLVKILLGLYSSSDNLLYLKDMKHIIKNIENHFTLYLNIIPVNISNIKFNELIDQSTEFNIIVLEELFNNYTYPFNFDKRTLNHYFVKILIYSFKYYQYIIDCDIKFINNKIKSVYLFLLKIYKSLNKDNISILYNSRIYTDNILNNIIKNIFFNDTYNLLKNIKICKKNICDIFIQNTITVQILSNLTWKNISKQLLYFKYIINIKNNSSELLIVDGKLNRNIVSINMDNRLKRIIIDPLSMYNYLKRESDFHKWTINFKSVITKIFNNPIILKENDYLKLSKILYLISKTTIQSLDNKEYFVLINYIKHNSHIILFNDRINIKIKDIFKNNNLNYGYFAKHINELSENNMISITENNVYSDISFNDDITLKLNKLAKKYYKYKGKYLEIKTIGMSL